MRIGAIIQARTSSTRLPNKVLMNLPYGSDVTVLEQVIRRVKKSTRIDDITVATTTDKTDDEIVKIAEKEKVNWFRGSKENVLQRYIQAAKKYHYDIIVRITSDCPCIDPQIIDLCLSQHQKNKADYTSNSLSNPYPKGMDVEIINLETLEKTFQNAKSASEKEHVTYYIYKTASQLFNILNIQSPYSTAESNIRLTLDTVQDYIFFCKVFDKLYSINNFFSLPEIIELIKEKPWIQYINSPINQTNI